MRDAKIPDERCCHFNFLENGRLPTQFHKYCIAFGLELNY
jgi:hypothetical protein